MEPFPWLANSDGWDMEGALHGKEIDLTRFAAKGPREALAEVATGLQVKELEFGALNGTAYYLAKEAQNYSLIVPINGNPQKAFDIAFLMDAVQRAVISKVNETRVVTGYEAYYSGRPGTLPLPALYVGLGGANRPGYYIDIHTGKVVQSYTRFSRWNRWLYHGMHSLDLPWFYQKHPWWDLTVLLLLAGGTALSVTALVIAAKVLRRKLLL